MGSEMCIRDSVQAAFVAVHDRLPGPAELSALLGRINAFGMLA